MMDVRCNRCGTEYELEDARVAQSGTTVKCSSCSHVFRVLPSGKIQSGVITEPAFSVGSIEPLLGNFPSPASTQPSAPPAAPAAPVGVGEWMIKKVDGSTFRFRELTTLQKWIVERKVGRDDEISRSAKTWKRLGDIAELTSFFQVVEAADAAQRAPGLQSQVTNPALLMAQMPNLQLSATPTGTISAVSIPPPAALTIDQAPLAGPTQPPIRSFPEVARPLEQPSAEVDDLDDDDPVLAWQRSRRNRMATAVVVLAAVLVVVIVGLVSSGTSALDLDVQRSAETALKSDDDNLREAALAQLLPHAEDPIAQAWRARLLTARAQSLLDASRLTEQLSKLGSPASASLSSIGAGEKLVAEATAIVLALRSTQPVPAEVDLAAAALALAKEDAPALSREVALAQEQAQHSDEGQRAAVDTEARLLLTLFEARPGLDAAAAAESLQKLARFDDGRARAAAAMVAVSVVVDSRTKVAAPPDAIAVAAALVGALADGDARKPLAQQILVVAATAPVAAPLSIDGAQPASGAGQGVAGAASAVPDTYEVLMQKAEKALVSERSQAAYELLKKALVLRPEIARPWLKLGWAAMDTNRNSEAQRAFQKALDIDGSLSEAQFGFAEALRFDGKKADAVLAYKAYLQMDPAGKEAHIAQNAIQQLE